MNDIRHGKAPDRSAVLMTQAWLDAIRRATEIVTPNHRANVDTDMEASLRYIESLGAILQQQTEQWDEPPTEAPPPFEQAWPLPDNGLISPPVPTIPVGVSANRFATFEDDDEEEDEVDIPVVQSPLPNSNNLGTTSLSMRRLMIRVVTGQSELYACQASHAPPRWKLGADRYQASLERIHAALFLADSECARWLACEGKSPAPLQEDAKVVEVAIDFLTNQLEKFRRKALQKERQLQRKLEPQWQKRDEIRQNWGEEKWNHNPHPRRDYAKLRQADEEQLREIQAALAQLNTMDTTSAMESSQKLKKQCTTSKQSKKKKRDNGKRPRDTSKRVSLQDYPDPTLLGWTFTGSWKNSLEFFENADGVKLDWYFLTATVKTHDATQPLFSGRVKPETYRAILQNPRAYTNNAVQHESKPTRQLWEPKAY